MNKCLNCSVRHCYEVNRSHCCWQKELNFNFLIKNVADSKNLQLYMHCYVVNIIFMSINMITRCGEYIIQL